MSDGDKAVPINHWHTSSESEYYTATVSNDYYAEAWDVSKEGVQIDTEERKRCKLGS